MKESKKEPRILIVDDTLQNLQVIGTILREKGYQLNVAQNGKKALEMAELALPDLTLLDIMMLEMDGMEACRRLKAQESTRDIPIIFLTAKVETDDIVKGFELGAVDYITKRFNAHELLARVHTHLQLKAAREKIAQLADTLSHYLSPNIYASIFSGETDATIASYHKPPTIFFSDIVSFTPRVETMAPAELTDWLNNYLNEMAAICHQYGGTLDKFMGDGIMGFFGDPESKGEKQDALQCVHMAQAMQQRAGELDVEIRIGINSGQCTVGNFGSDNQMAYTIIGPSVNLAARLEPSADPGKILISESSYHLVGDEITCSAHGNIRVKGIERDINTYWVDNT
jgi:adenylate cyclase